MHGVCEEHQCAAQQSEPDPIFEKSSNVISKSGFDGSNMHERAMQASRAGGLDAWELRVSEDAVRAASSSGFDDIKHARRNCLSKQLDWNAFRDLDALVCSKTLFEPTVRLLLMASRLRACSKRFNADSRGVFDAFEASEKR